MTDYSNIPDCFYRVSIKALFLDEQGRFLLCREHDGRWSFPGGGYEYSDTSPISALSREIHEEMGLKIVSIDTYPAFLIPSKSPEGFIQLNIYYKAFPENLDFVPSGECQEIRFFTPSEALELDAFPSIAEFCKHYK